VLVSTAHADQKLVYDSMFVAICLTGGEQVKLEALAIRPDRPGRFPRVVIVHGTQRGTGPELRTKLARMSQTITSDSPKLSPNEAMPRSRSCDASSDIRTVPMPRSIRADAIIAIILVSREFRPRMS
jgi:hypothetical protein